MSTYARANLRITNEKQKENSREGITWSEMGKQNVQAEKVYWNFKLKTENERLIRDVDILLFFGGRYKMS